MHSLAEPVSTDLNEMLRALARGEPVDLRSPMPYGWGRAVDKEGLTGLALLQKDNVLDTDDPEIMDMLARWKAREKRRLLLELELERIAAHLPPDLSPPILLKGQAVAQCYPDPQVRMFGDLDLLVPKAGFDRWAAFAEDLGFAQPGPWTTENARRHFNNEIAFRKTVGSQQAKIDLHHCLFLEKSARKLDYEVLCQYAEPSPLPSILWLSRPLQLIVCSIHLARHARWSRRLIWLRDLIQLATPQCVTQARLIAAKHGVSWAVEYALNEVEELLEEVVFCATPERRPFGLASVQDRFDPGSLYQLALMREIGLRSSIRYLVSRLAPSRFRETGEAPLDWGRGVVRKFANTRWWDERR